MNVDLSGTEEIVWTQSEGVGGVVHVRGEYVVVGAEAQEAAATGPWFWLECERRFPGEKRWRHLSVCLEGRFERNDLVLRCYARFSVIPTTLPKGEREFR